MALRLSGGTALAHTCERSVNVKGVCMCAWLLCIHVPVPLSLTKECRKPLVMMDTVQLLVFLFFWFLYYSNLKKKKQANTHSGCNLPLFCFLDVTQQKNSELLWIT